MPLRGILFDLVGPLILGDDGKQQNDAETMIAECNKRGLIVGAMSGRSRSLSTRALAKSGLVVDSLHCTGDSGCDKNKGSGDLVAAFCADNSLQPHEIVVVADEKFGMVEALNGKAFGFFATGQYTWGIKVDSHQEILEYIDVFFMKNALWYAKYDGFDAKGNAVTLRCLIDGNGAGSQLIKTAIIKTLKEREEPLIYGSISFPKFLMMHLIASMYLEGLLSRERRQFLWEIYPGHKPESEPSPIVNAVLSGFKIFRSKGDNAIERWRLALQSSKARRGDDRGQVKFANQISSIKLGRKSKASGKRVNIVDDFCTEGFSLEAARHLFNAAEAEEINLFAFGKYGPRFAVQTAEKATVVRPHDELTYADDAFKTKIVAVDINEAALPEFQESLKRLRGSSIAGKLLAGA